MTVLMLAEKEPPVLVKVHHCLTFVGSRGDLKRAMLSPKGKLTHQDLVRHSILGNLGSHCQLEFIYYHVCITDVIFQHNEGKRSWKESKD